MKIAQINKFYAPVVGGVEKHLQILAEGLKYRAEVTIIAANTGLRTHYDDSNHLRIIKLPSLGTLFSAPLCLSFFYLLKKIKADVLHFHFPYPIASIGYLLTRPRGKVVVTFHNAIVRQKFLGRLLRPVEILFLKKADVIIAGSPQMIENSEILKQFRHKCRVIPLGIDINRFGPLKDWRDVKKIRSKYSERIILFVGRLVHYKGVEYLIRAMRAVDASLLVIGDGKLRCKLEELTEHLSLSDRVHFLGEVTDEVLPAYYHACDVFVLPSISPAEGFGLVQIEAQACGKAVISTSLPTGVPFVNLHQKTGLVVPPKNPDALADAINRLLDDSALRERYESHAMERAQCFRSELMVNRVFALYEELLNGKRDLI